MRTDVQNQQARRTGGLGGGLRLFGGKRGNATRTVEPVYEGGDYPEETDGHALNLRKPEERREAAPVERMTREEVHAAFPEETSDDSASGERMRVVRKSLTQQERDDALRFLMDNAFFGEDRAALQECLEYAQDSRQNFERLSAYIGHIRKRQDIAMQIMLAGFGVLLGDSYDDIVGAKWRFLADEWCQDPMVAAAEADDEPSE